MKGNIIPLAVGDISLPVDTGFAPFDVRYLPTPTSDPKPICSSDQRRGEPIQSHRSIFRKRDSILSRGSREMSTFSSLSNF